MWEKVKNFINSQSLTRKYIFASLIIIIFGLVVIGWWINMQIANGVIHRTSASAALYVENFIAHDLQELATTGKVLPAHLQELDQLIQSTPLGQQIVSFKVWNTSGVVQYSTDKSIIGKTFQIEGGLARALNGQVASSISRLSRPENIAEQAFASRLIETYIPVRLSGTDQVIAVVEFYQKVDELQGEISAARWRSWLVVTGVMSLIFILLSGFVTRANKTIERQKLELSSQVVNLSTLLQQNLELHERVRKAAASVATLNERLLRRLGAELHDGPAQDLSLALLQMDTIISQSEEQAAKQGKNHQVLAHMSNVQSTLEHAMNELRAIASGMSLPELADLSLRDTVSRVVRAHERRTNTSVELDFEETSLHCPLPLKITIYRLVQEALNNAYHHAKGEGQKVRVEQQEQQILVEISDCGPGIESSNKDSFDNHLGIAGMRERVESLGGYFSIESQPGQGTVVKARFGK